MKRALRAFRDDETATEEGIRWLWLAGGVAGRIWDYESWDALTGRQIQVARDARRTRPTLPLALGTRAVALIFAGELRAAASLVEESEAIVRATHGRINPYAPVVLAALRGRDDDFKRLIQTSTKDFMASGEGLGLTMAQWATAVLSNGLGALRGCPWRCRAGGRGSA